jgi:hypothetical protein
MALRGKGFMIWKVPSCEGGNAAQIATAAQAAGLTHVLIKIADGPYPYNVDKTTKVDLVPPVVAALHAKGIQAWGWHYVYGYNPAAEAQMAVQRVKELGLRGYVIDAEAEFEKPGMSEVAKAFMTELRKDLPQKPVALCAYRWPSYHPQFPWDAFLEKCDYNMPQVYWMQAHNPAAQLERTVREFNSMSYVRPIMPTGPVFREAGWGPTVAEIQEYLQACRDFNLNATNFFAWEYGRSNLRELWDAIAAFSWSPPAQPEKDIVERYIDALNSRDPAQVIQLFVEDALHITARRTLSGAENIRSWFTNFLGKKLPNGSFQLASATSINNSRHFSWTANSPSGAVHNGRDTFGLRNGKIAYHYSSFTVTQV